MVVVTCGGGQHPKSNLRGQLAGSQVVVDEDSEKKRRLKRSLQENENM